MVAALGASVRGLADEGEYLFARVLALGSGLYYFMACAVTGMLLALSTADRLLLRDDVQLQFSASECVELKHVHSARAIQIWWRWLWARWSRDDRHATSHARCA